MKSSKAGTLVRGYEVSSQQNAIPNRVEVGRRFCSREAVAGAFAKELLEENKLLEHEITIRTNVIYCLCNN